MALPQNRISSRKVQEIKRAAMEQVFGWPHFSVQQFWLAMTGRARNRQGGEFTRSLLQAHPNAIDQPLEQSAAADRGLGLHRNRRLRLAVDRQHQRPDPLALAHWR